jgi:hypothetical protein
VVEDCFYRSCNGLQNWVMSPCASPWFRAVEHPFRMCTEVGFGHKQRWHFGSVWILHLHRFRGVGKQSAPAFSMKLNWPAGRPAWILVQILHPASSNMMSLNLGCTARVSRWLFQYEAWCAWVVSLAAFFSWRAGFTGGSSLKEDQAVCRRSKAEVGIDLWRFCSDKLATNSQRMGSCDVEMARR